MAFHERPSTHQTRQQINLVQTLLNVILALNGGFQHNLRSERTLNVLTGVKLQSLFHSPRLQCVKAITDGCEATVVVVAVAVAAVANAVVDVEVPRGYLIIG